MIQAGEEYVIRFTRDDIRCAAGHYERNGKFWGWVNAEFTDEQCDRIAEELSGLFEDEFSNNVKNMEV